ncbi:MAG: sulfate adenylyltransferase [Opitutaceae bacterium]|nr:sulfate adenylyltransferase [Opitutaceae bacterium]
MPTPDQNLPASSPDLLRVLIAGSVDDGKSTLVGRLLLDTKTLLDDQLSEIESITQQRGEEHLNLSLITDGLRAEREQGITIDVAYRYFATPRRRFIIADTPGHIQYTRNMITGASTAQLAIILVDARHGLTEQTRRHVFIASLMQIQHLVIAINKMDLVAWAEEAFQNIVIEFKEFASRLSIPDIKFIPMAALHGDNIVASSARLPWYQGQPLLPTLEAVYSSSSENQIDARFPIQSIIRPHNDRFHDFRGLAGCIAGGVFKIGDEIIALPSGLRSRIKSIAGPDGEITEAFAPMAVVMTLTDDGDISRGDLLTKPLNRPQISQNIEAMLCWMSPDELQVDRRYLLQLNTREVHCVVQIVRYKIDFDTLHQTAGEHTIRANNVARVALRTSAPLAFDPFKQNRITGSFILIAESTHETLAAGMIIQPNLAGPTHASEAESRQA